MTWVASGVAAATAVYGGIQAQNAAEARAGEARRAGAGAMSEAALDEELRNQEATSIMATARREADNIRRQAQTVRAGVLVAQSGSGAVIGEGSAQAALDQIEALSSADALAALYGAVNAASSKRMAGRLALQTGRETFDAMGRRAATESAAGDAALFGSLLSAAGSVAGGYAKATPAAPKDYSGAFAILKTNRGSGD